ncbi:winged helix-turn-helix transcriptional regulator [Thermaerobacter marianensis]|uniref:winged helix-turn-helix transcriptional regulator n=1 Tax=Thermaerobacter marianensis TaxID=73919 RepID=UPI002417A790|nr:helix-turn-helix domain-containing protein [Thermaerobacter marianensis]
MKVCPRYEQAVQILGKKWTGLILRVLMTGKKRFCDFKASLPEMSDRMLSERLKELEEAGILVRHVRDTRPVLIEYELTEKGRALEPVVAAIQAWADRWCDGVASHAPDGDAGGRPAGPGGPSDDDAGHPWAGTGRPSDEAPAETAR